MYAIQNIITGKFVYGTDYRSKNFNNIFKQFTSNDKMLTYEDYYEATDDFKHRGCGKDYRIVALKPIEVEKIIDFDKSNGYTTYWDKLEH